MGSLAGTVLHSFRIAGSCELGCGWGQMDSMTSARELLEAERELARTRVAALEREFTGLAEAASALGTDDEHDPEGATLAFERQHAAALLEAARAQVAAVDAALERVAQGRYGVCEVCGEPIGAERLAARPAATTCVHCAGRGGAGRGGAAGRR